MNAMALGLAVTASSYFCSYHGLQRCHGSYEERYYILYEYDDKQICVYIYIYIYIAMFGDDRLRGSGDGFVTSIDGGPNPYYTSTCWIWSVCKTCADINQSFHYTVYTIITPSREGQRDSCH